MNLSAMLQMAIIVLIGFGLGALSIWLMDRGARPWMLLTGICALLVLVAGFLP